MLEMRRTNEGCCLEEREDNTRVCFMRKARGLRCTKSGLKGFNVRGVVLTGIRSGRTRAGGTRRLSIHTSARRVFRRIDATITMSISLTQRSHRSTESQRSVGGRRISSVLPHTLEPTGQGRQQRNVGIPQKHHQEYRYHDNRC